MIKYLFQKAIERRPDQGDATRPFFLWEDEAAQFFTEFDPEFQQTAGSSRVARVMLSQTHHRDANIHYLRRNIEQVAKLGWLTGSAHEVISGTSLFW